MDERIIEFSYRPTSDRRRAMPTFFAVLSVSAVLVALSTFLPKYKGVVSLFAMIGLCASVLIFTRYFLAEFVYSVVVSNDGDALFVIVRVTGKRESTMCTVRMADITSVTPKTGEAAQSSKPDPVSKKFKCVPDFSPQAFYLITASSSTLGKQEIMISGTEELAARIWEYALIERERVSLDED